MKIKWIALAAVCLALAGPAMAQGTDDKGGTMDGGAAGVDRSTSTGVYRSTSTDVYRSTSTGVYGAASAGVDRSTSTGVDRSTGAYRPTSTDMDRSTSGAGGYDPRGGSGGTEESRPGRRGP